MFTQLEFLIAFRYLRSKRSEGFISVIAGFSLLGIILGVSTLIIVMSVMNGFRAELIGRILGLNGHLGVYESSGFLTDFDKHAVAIGEVPDVITVTPQIEGQGLLVKNNISTGVVVRGVRWTDLSARKQLWNSLNTKDPDGFKENRILIGKRLGERLGIKLGDKLVLITTEMQITAFGSVPKQQKFIVSGIFDVGMYEYDNSFVFIDLIKAQSLFGHLSKNSISNLEVYIKNSLSVEKVKNRIAEIAQPGLLITDWQQRNATFINALKVERNVMFLILTLIIMVAAFNIISSMIMFVRSKTIDIAVLSAVGASPSTIMKVFFITGASIGFIGTIIGTILGLLVCFNIDSIRKFLENFTNNDLFSAEIYFLTKLPALVDLSEVSQIVLMALLLSFLASIYPAWRATKILPAEVLRYE